MLINENWLSRSPIPLEDYEYAVEVLGREWPGPVLAGSNYVMDRDGSIRSVGLALLGGSITRICEKVFPSMAVGERGRIRAGRLLRPIEVNGWRIACVVCVDIFYPEIARFHTINGAEVIYNPASITSDRVGLWRSVLLTRAAENTVYTVGVNGVGNVYPDGRITLGGSAVFAPNGVMIGSHGMIEGIRFFSISRELIERIRERWAFHRDLTGSLARIYSDLDSVLVGAETG